MNASTRTRRTPVVIAAVLLAVFFLVLANWKWPVLRLEPVWLNPPVLLAAMALPWVALIFAWRSCSKPRQRVAAFAILSPVLLYAATCAPLVTMEASDGLRERSDRAFQRIAALPLQHGRLAVYRTNGGATTSFGIAVRQELPLLPHLLLVRDLEGFYPAQDATIAKLGERAARVTVPAYGDKAPVRSRVYRLRRFVY